MINVEMRQMDMLQIKNMCVSVPLQAKPLALKIEEIEEVLFDGKALAHKSLETSDWSEASKAFSLVGGDLTYIGQVLLKGSQKAVEECSRIGPCRPPGNHENQRTVENKGLVAQQKQR